MKCGEWNLAVWSDPTEALLWHKFLENLMLAMIEPSQNTQCHVSQLAVYRAALLQTDQSRLPLLTPVHNWQSLYGNMSLRTRPWSNGRMEESGFWCYFTNYKFCKKFVKLSVNKTKLFQYQSEISNHSWN